MFFSSVIFDILKENQIKGSGPYNCICANWCSVDCHLLCVPLGFYHFVMHCWSLWWIRRAISWQKWQLALGTLVLSHIFSSFLLICFFYVFTLFVYIWNVCQYWMWYYVCIYIYIKMYFVWFSKHALRYE